jgi:hypothetical protein
MPADDAPAIVPLPPRLFSGEAILAHTLLLTPVTGSLLAAINHRRLGHGPASRSAILLFAVPSAILLVAQLVTNDWVSAIVRLAAFVWTVWLARRLYVEHQAIHAKHVAAGGPTAHWYLATLVAVGAAVLGLVAVFASELLP